MPTSVRRVVVIPAFQAGQTIGRVVQGARTLGFSVIVVDDASRDQTADSAADAGAQVVRLPKNVGKGAALREGFTRALEEGFDGVLTMDSDGQHLPQEISRFIEAASNTGADLIVGNRMADPGGMPWIRQMTNRWMSWLLSKLIQQRVPDSQCGFRLVSRRVLEKVALRCDRFETESELLVRASWAGFQIASVPVTCVYLREISFIRPFRDTLRFLGFLWSIRRSR